MPSGWGNFWVPGVRNNARPVAFIPLPFGLKFHPSTHPSIYLSIRIHQPIYLFFYVSIFLFIYLSIYLSIHPTIYLSISLSTYLSFYLPIYLSIYLTICLSNSSVHLYIYPFYFFPTLTCGVFVFSSVSAFLLRLPSSSLTHSHSLTHSLTHSLAHPPTHSLTHSLTYSLTHSLTHSRLRGRRGTMCTAKGSDVRPGVPWVPPLLRGRRGTMCTAKGSDVRPGVPWAPPLLRGRRGTMCIAKGSDVRPGIPSAPPLNAHCQGVGCTPWRPLGSASFAWQARDNAHCQGVGCTCWCPLGSASFATHPLTHAPTHPPTHPLTHSHTCSETSYRITDVECIVRAKTLQLNLTDTVKTVPFCGETERITKMMWPPALQQHPGASLRFLFLGETDRITKWCDHQLCNSIQVRQYGSLFLARRTESPNDVTTSYATASRCITTVPFHGETDRRITKWCDHQLCNSIQVRQYGSLFLARRTESPNDVTTSYATASRCITTVQFHGETDRITKWCDHQLYATASRCITTVPFRGETGRITTCRYKILRPVSHPPIVHSFVGTARTSGAVPPALNATLRFLFRGETHRITKRSDHQLCNSIQVRHDGSFFLPRRTESPGRSFTSIQMFHTHAPQQRGILVVR